MLELTQRQREVLSYMIQYCRDHGYSPSVRDILRHFEFRSTNAVTVHLRPLLKKGYVQSPPKIEGLVNQATARHNSRTWIVIRDLDGNPICPYCGNPHERQ